MKKAVFAACILSIATPALALDSFKWPNMPFRWPSHEHPTQRCNKSDADDMRVIKAIVAATVSDTHYGIASERDFGLHVFCDTGNTAAMVDAMQTYENRLGLLYARLTQQCEPAWSREALLKLWAIKSPVHCESMNW